MVHQNPRSILILAHETSKTTAHDVVPYTLEKLRGAGYEIVTVDECLSDRACHSLAESYVERDATRVCSSDQF